MAKKNEKTNSQVKHATIFGAALSSAFVAQEIQADVLDITWDGGLESVAINFAETDGYSPPHLLGIDQLGPGVDLRVRNTLISYTFPLTYYGMGSGFFRYTYRNVRNTGQAVTAILGGVELGDLIDPQNPAINDTYVRFNEVDNPAFFAFRTTDGNVGWFRVDDEGNPQAQRTATKACLKHQFGS